METVECKSSVVGLPIGLAYGDVAFVGFCGIVWAGQIFQIICERSREMSKNRTTRWYVEPRDADTNESAMADLMLSSGATEDKLHYGKKDNQGKPHDVVEVGHPFVAKMERNAVKFNQLYRVFKQTEGESRMNLWRFGGQSKLSRTKEIKRVKKEHSKLSKTNS